MGGAFSFCPLPLYKPAKVFESSKVLFLNQVKPKTFSFGGLKSYWVTRQMPDRVVTLEAAYQKAAVYTHLHI